LVAIIAAPCTQINSKAKFRFLHRLLQGFKRNACLNLDNHAGGIDFPNRTKSLQRQRDVAD
jgi:hypothetical protein